MNEAETLNVYMAELKVNGKPSNGVTNVMIKPGDNKSIDAVHVNSEWVGLGYHLTTHEVGHWLGLWHTFDSKSWKDGIDDIAEQDDDTDMDCEHCPPKVKDNLKSGSNFTASNYNNFMDYSGCRAMFSNKQAVKMRAIILSCRPKIYSNSSR